MLGGLFTSRFFFEAKDLNVLISNVQWVGLTANIPRVNSRNLDSVIASEKSEIDVLNQVHKKLTILEYM